MNDTQPHELGREGRPGNATDTPPLTIPVDPLADLATRLEAIEQRLGETQAMAARTYEAVLNWSHEVNEMRQDPSYEEAFEGEPLVSVRVATYNAAELLCERALPSLIRQDYQRWECAVVGDCCTDNTEERVTALGDPRITFTNLPFRGPYPQNAKERWYVAGGPPANAGIAAARGSWIAPLDHDDEWDDDHISVLLAHAMTNRSEVAYGRIRTVYVATGQTGEMGAWPPERGQFGFLGAVHHQGLARFHYDANCRFADEPGDWNLARRLWEAGVRFSFLDRPVATHFHVPKHAELSTEQRMIEELRSWGRLLEEAKEYWHERAEEAEAALAERSGRPEERS